MWHPLDEAAAWRGAELFARPGFDVRLEPPEARELAAAAEGPGAPDAAASAPRWAAVRRALETGPGAVRVRGLALEGLGDEQRERLLLRIAAQLGTPLSQSARGERVLRVRDEGYAPDDPRFRGPHSRRGLGFHTDRCDVIAFLCVRPARAGGETQLVSSVALARELARRDPAALAVLREPFPYLRHTVDPANPRAWTGVPVFTEREGRFAACYLRVLIDRADRSPDAPVLTAAQRAALDALDALAAEPGLQARLRLAPGELLLLNNWVTFHRRTPFEDHADPARRRLLLRVWLSTPDSRALDPRLSDHFGDTAAGALRGGILSSCVLEPEASIAPGLGSGGQGIAMAAMAANLSLAASSLDLVGASHSLAAALALLGISWTVHARPQSRQISPAVGPPSRPDL